MPTPFNHLRVAQRLLKDPDVPSGTRHLLQVERGAFLLGNIAADARVSSGLPRAETHFYQYDQPMIEHPWQVMLSRYPIMATNEAQQAFIAGYVAHLSMDELWTTEILLPLFFEREWGIDRGYRFFMLNVLLAYLDERDYGHLEGWQADALFAARPDHWLPFIPDPDLCAWRDLVAQQLVNESQTLSILGARARRTPEEFRAVLDSPSKMQADLWDNVPPDAVQQVERHMYTFAREQMLVYLESSA